VAEEEWDERVREAVEGYRQFLGEDRRQYLTAIAWRTWR
jgi:hypothetical protein